MKTTIELSDALAEEARSYAREHGTTLRDLLESGLRAELGRRQGERPVRTLSFPTFAGRGLQPDVAPESMIERGYGLPR